MQEIITYTIVAAAFIFALYKVILVFFPAADKNKKYKNLRIAHEGGCSNCSGDCAVRDLVSQK